MPLYEGQRLPPMINLQQYYIEDALLAAVARANADQPGLHRPALGDHGGRDRAACRTA